MFKSKIFERFINMEREKFALLKNDNYSSDYEEGIINCKKCGNKNVDVTSMQTRSRDEGTTAFAKCVKFKATWVV